MQLPDMKAKIEDLRSRGSTAALAYVSLLASILTPTIHFLLAAEFERAAISVSLGIATALLAKRALPARRGQLTTLRVFTGVRPLDARHVWRRPELSKAALNRIVAAKSEPTFFAGRSGSGKSTLFLHEVLPELRSHGWSTVVISRYDGIVLDLATALGGVVGAQALQDLQFSSALLATPDRPTLILFDQLEQLLHESAQVQEWVRYFMGHVLVNKDLRVVGVFRQEYFYELRSLGPAVPRPYHVDEIAALEAVRDPHAVAALSSRLANVASSEVVERILPSSRMPRFNSSDAGSAALPIEMQMLGEVLEREFQRTGRKIDERAYRRLGGERSTLLSRYFENYVAASTDSGLARAVMFALSVAAPPRSLSLKELADATFSTTHRIDSIIEFLEAEHLVHGSEDDRLQFAHDALAALYHEQAASRLPAGMREAVSHRVNHAGTLVRSPLDAKPHIVLSTLVFTIMVLGVGISVARSVGTAAVLNYAIVAPAHLAWALFMYRLAVRFFVRLPGFAAWLWVPLAAVGSFSLGWTMQTPTSWIASMGLMGFVLGLSLWIIALRQRLSDVARREFRTTANSFLVVALTMGLAGWAFERVASSCPQLSDRLALVTLAMSLGFVVMSVASTAKYAGDAPVKAWLGHVDRA